MLANIAKSVSSANEYQVNIAAAIEEQSATTADVTRRAAELTESVQTISSNIGRLAK